MLHQPLPSTTASNSPANKTFELLKERLEQAESEAQKLSSQLVSYGFKTSPAKNNNKDSTGSQSVSDNRMISRVCKMESVLESLRSGINSLEADKSETPSQLLLEKNQIQETYSLKIQELQEEVDKQKAVIKCHIDAKLLLEKQIAKLKKASVKRTETQKALLTKLKEKDNELASLQNELNQIKKNVSKEVESRKRIEDSHSLLHLKISEMEATVEAERMNVSKVNAQCESLTNDAMLARKEFEREYTRRLDLENILEVQSNNIECIKEEINIKSGEYNQVKKQCQDLESQCQQFKRKCEKLQKALEASSSENQELKELLKVASVDNQALVIQSKEVLLREQAKVKNIVAQQNKLLDSTKASMLQELKNQHKNTERTESENLLLKRKIVEYESKHDESDFKLKMLEQNYTIEISRLEAALLSSQNKNDELRKQLEAIEKEGVLKNNNLQNDKLHAMQRVQELEEELKQVQLFGQRMKHEKNELMDKLSWISMSQQSQNDLEKKMVEMVKEKNSLAYEKGILSSKVKTLEVDNKTKKEIEVEYENLMLKYKDLNTQFKRSQKSEDKLNIEIEEKVNALQAITTEHNLCKNMLKKTEKHLSQVISARDEALNETEKLVRHVKDITTQYDEQVSCLQSRLLENEKQRSNIGGTFETLMSTNDQLQKQLQLVQENLGKKDAQLETLKDTRNVSKDVISQLQAELVSLTNKLNLMEKENNEEIVKIKERLYSEKKEKTNYQNMLQEKEEEQKHLKEKVMKLKLELKKKDTDIKTCIAAKNNNIETANEKKEIEVAKLKTQHKKEINKLKSQLHDVKLLLKKKENINKEKIKVMSDGLINLENDKSLYMEKNKEQAELLSKFMSEIADLQNELTTMAESQNGTSFNLRVHETKSERKKRQKIEIKHKDDMNSLRKHSHSNTVDKLLMEEKKQTQDLIRKCKNTMENDERKLDKLSKQLEDLHRRT
ncbi:putative leucine-rich repeat-containing protein DDB_G0290503 isoform X1 [Hydractinia symbiolongicarpus]|uniref:putative leucine-rich repeat-containing protein DDB_G0290503 isoform X1 n=1 Tax=Hydractinia symbiolongicarpus TaxID=13093 RepID=UPI00254D8BDF|nr:putative leucine-rich repeat-containing protein DDB_G0290503 isoform X1 [Hydractinia symbiolongicarpus]